MTIRTEALGTVAVAITGTMAASLASHGSPDLGGISLGDVLDYGSKITGSAALLLMVVGFIRGWLVPKYVFDSMKEDRDAWRKQAETTTSAVRQVAPVAAKTNDVAEQLMQVMTDVMQRKGAST